MILQILVAITIIIYNLNRFIVQAYKAYTIWHLHHNMLEYGKCQSLPSKPNNIREKLEPTFRGESCMGLHCNCASPSFQYTTSYHYPSHQAWHLNTFTFYTFCFNIIVVMLMHFVKYWSAMNLFYTWLFNYHLLQLSFADFHNCPTLCLSQLRHISFYFVLFNSSLTLT